MATTIFWILFSTSMGVVAGLMARSFLAQRTLARSGTRALEERNATPDASDPPPAPARLGGPPVAVITALNQDRGRTWLLRRGGTMTIGRIEECDIAVPQPSVSRLHAQINHRADVAQAHEFTIFDYSSTNGTRVNGKPINTVATLQDGNEIGIGTQRFRFERVRR